MTYSAVNTIWVLLGAALVFFMQAGFSMCEAGFTRAKNTGNILMKNLMDFCIGTPCFWLFGFGMMFGLGSGLFGWLDPLVTQDYSHILPAGVPAPVLRIPPAEGLSLATACLPEGIPALALLFGLIPGRIPERLILFIH